MLQLNFVLINMISNGRAKLNAGTKALIKIEF